MPFVLFVAKNLRGLIQEPEEPKRNLIAATHSRVISHNVAILNIGYLIETFGLTAYLKSPLSVNDEIADSGICY